LYIICEWVFEHYYESLRQGLDDVNDYVCFYLISIIHFRKNL